MPHWLIDSVGILAGVIGTLCWLPQVVKTIRTRETRDLSLFSNLMMFVTIGLWLIYALGVGAWPMVGSNVIGLAMVGTIIVLKLKHG